MKLLVAALQSEIVAFPAEIEGFDVLVTGPGKLQATFALTRALEHGDYERIVVVGTAGSLDRTLPRGVHLVTSAIQHDVSDLDGIVGQHVSLPARLDVPGGGMMIATGDHFVDDPADVRRIRGMGAELVDMEIYAYLWVAAQFGVPIEVAKAVSDDAQDDAHSDWTAAVTACSAELWDWFRARYPV